MKYCYSFDEAEYHGEYDTVEAALAGARSNRGEHGSGARVWIAEIVPAWSFLYDFVSKLRPYADNILEAADDCVSDYVVSDDPVFSLTDEHKDEFNELTVRFLEDHAKCSAYGIRNPVEYSL